MRILGTIAESAVMFRLSCLGLPVFTEMGNNTRIDIITIVDKKLVSIQVKQGFEDNGSIKAELRKVGPSNYKYIYQVDDFDVLAVYSIKYDKVIWISSKEALKNNINSINFRTELPKNNAKKNIRLMEDYLDFYKALL